MPNPQMTSANSERYVAAPASHFDIVKPGTSLNEAFMMIGAAVRFERNTEVYSEEEPAEYFYLVVSGAARTYKLLSDGRRQIGAFYFPGSLVTAVRQRSNSWNKASAYSSGDLVANSVETELEGM